MAGRWSRPETCWNNSFLTERCVNAVVAIASKINLSEGRASWRASGIEDHEKDPYSEFAPSLSLSVTRRR
ncbi:hypothetical protein D6F49_11260 [Salmonella enterica]|nr:hypothetical protein [Salmonella enterica]EBH8988614.1 hypothetical protein [Salmonella enterica subsp. enterica serovar Gallinarum]EBX7450292.1 hypothetical protein [Salmonella enterica subsp. enterica serovar Typhimurium]